MIVEIVNTKSCSIIGVVRAAASALATTFTSHLARTGGFFVT
jgi:hypothetical protein